MADELIEQQPENKTANLAEGQNSNLSGQGKLVLILVILGVVLVLYLISASSRGLFPFSEKIIASPTPAPTAISTPDETSDWKTYRNKDFGFEFRYDKNWKLSDDNRSPYLEGQWVSNLKGKTIFLCLPPTGCQDATIIISVVEDSTLDEVFKYEKSFKTVGHLRDINFVGLPATEGTFSSGTSIVVPKDKLILIISGWHNHDNKLHAYKVFNQILSTFKFIPSTSLGTGEPNQSDQPCIQVITPARNPETGEVKDFPTPCDVPEGWIKL